MRSRSWTSPSAELGELDKAALLEARALEIHERAGNLAGQGLVYNNMGVFAYFQGQWDEAHRAV